MHAEQVGPEWDALRHAELMAALHNGPLQKQDKTLFKASDFTRDPWAPPKPAPDPQDAFYRMLDSTG
jgi:hypothetical protein